MSFKGPIFEDSVFITVNKRDNVYKPENDKMRREL